MRNTDNHFRFLNEEERTRREALRKTLRVIPGGKETPSPASELWDHGDFRNDKFLRSHFLERSHGLESAPPKSPYLWEDEPLNPWE